MSTPSLYQSGRVTPEIAGILNERSVYHLVAAHTQNTDRVSPPTTAGGAALLIPLGAVLDCPSDFARDAEHADDESRERRGAAKPPHIFVDQSTRPELIADSLYLVVDFRNVFAEILFIFFQLHLQLVYVFAVNHGHYLLLVINLVIARD